MRRTLRPRASRIAPRQAEVMPLPSEDTTPPVMKMNRVMSKPGGPDATSEGSTRPAIEVEWLVHRDGIAKYQKYLASPAPHRERAVSAVPARAYGGCSVHCTRQRGSLAAPRRTSRANPYVADRDEAVAAKQQRHAARASTARRRFWNSASANDDAAGHAVETARRPRETATSSRRQATTRAAPSSAAVGTSSIAAFGPGPAVSRRRFAQRRSGGDGGRQRRAAGTVPRETPGLRRRATGRASARLRVRVEQRVAQLLELARARRAEPDACAVGNAAGCVAAPAQAPRAPRAARATARRAARASSAATASSICSASLICCSEAARVLQRPLGQRSRRAGSTLQTQVDCDRGAARGSTGSSSHASFQASACASSSLAREPSNGRPRQPAAERPELDDAAQAAHAGAAQ